MSKLNSFVKTDAHMELSKSQKFPFAKATVSVDGSDKVLGEGKNSKDQINQE